STTAPTGPRVATPISPSAATRPALLAAAAKPFFLSQSTAASISPPLSPSALLQSIIPAPVFSRNSLTSAAVTSAIGVPPVYAPSTAAASASLGGALLSPPFTSSSAATCSP